MGNGQYKITQGDTPRTKHSAYRKHRTFSGHFLYSPTQQSGKTFTVTELNREVKSLLESEYPEIRLRGEVSNLQTAQSGHTYFKLKDQSAEIDCALFRGAAARQRNKPVIGLEVVVTGQVTLYPNKGRYQFIVSKVELKDQGELYKAFLDQKARLEKKGYFADDRKRALPAFSTNVGIITSPTGAAVHDIIRTFNRRNPTISLLVYPTAVQGAGAAEQIADAIKLANTRNCEDVLIVARGGGDMEDLWAFNESVVADAIFSSEIPIVTGIGHETDFTIADFVADARAATPTAAAERVSTPSRDELLDALANRQVRLSDLTNRKLNELSQGVDLAQKGLVHPAQRIQNQQGKFEQLQNRLVHITSGQLSSFSVKVLTENQRLLATSPKNLINLFGQRTTEINTLLQIYMTELHGQLANRIENLHAKLESSNPEAALNRGFSIIRRADDNSIVSRASVISSGDKVKAQLSEGTLHCEVESVEV